jgi:tRNA (adenine37-N6)-methyltransferase
MAPGPLPGVLAIAAATAAAAGVVAAIAVAVKAWRAREAALRQELDDEMHRRQRAEQLRAEERAGRIAAERRLREALHAQHQPATESTGGVVLRPIGFVESVFVGRLGTPRQPFCVPSSRARVRILPSVVEPRGALERLGEFSHAWVLFVFHENTNAGGATTKACVRPPRLDGASAGVFSTRSPHRPNPIGLSLVRIARVVGDVVYLAGVDLLHGTPVLDIKPFVPDCDVPAHGLESVRCPPWIDAARDAGEFSVEIEPAAQGAIDRDESMRTSNSCGVRADTLESLFEMGRLPLFESIETVRDALSEILNHDIRCALCAPHLRARDP